MEENLRFITRFNVLTCEIIMRQKSLLLVQFRTTAYIDLRIDDHIIIFTGNFEYFNLVVQADEHQRSVVEYRQIVPMVRCDVIAEYSGDLRVVAEIQLDVHRSVHYGGRYVVRRTVDFPGSVKQSRVVPFRLSNDRIKI